MTDQAWRAKLHMLDACLAVLEGALEHGQTRIDGPLAGRLRRLLGEADLVPDHRLEGRRIDRVLDEIFELQRRH